MWWDDIEHLLITDYQLQIVIADAPAGKVEWTIWMGSDFWSDYTNGCILWKRFDIWKKYQFSSTDVWWRILISARKNKQFAGWSEQKTKYYPLKIRSVKVKLVKIYQIV